MAVAAQVAPSSTAEMIGQSKEAEGPTRRLSSTSKLALSRLAVSRTGSFRQPRQIPKAQSEPASFHQSTSSPSLVAPPAPGGDVPRRRRFSLLAPPSTRRFSLGNFVASSRRGSCTPSCSSTGLGRASIGDLRSNIAAFLKANKERGDDAGPGGEEQRESVGPHVERSRRHGATAHLLASRSEPPRALDTPRTLNEPPNRSAPKGRLRCGQMRTDQSRRFCSVPH